MEILQASGVTRYFGGVAAIDGVDFGVKKGEIFGLIGPNGAGKTTLLNMISGIHPLSKGEIKFKGEVISGKKPWDIAKSGIARTFQIVKPFNGMTVRENVAVGALFGHVGKPSALKVALEQADRTLEFVQLDHKRNSLASEMTLAQRKRLELARALAMEPELLLLDEVMAGLNLKEVAEIMELIKKINESGVTILIIEHVMKVIMEISDQVLVLYYGRKVALDKPQAISVNPKVIEIYLGERYVAKQKMRKS
ncbi:MAG: ABC transporter ATP-binding protein [Desulfitobacteriaceae bacterium]